MTPPRRVCEQLYMPIAETGPAMLATTEGYTYRCGQCGWRTGIWPKKKQARAAFASHRCPA